MWRKPIILSSVLVGLFLVGVAHAGLHSGYVVMKHPGIECRENRMLNWTSSGRYSQNLGQGYVLDKMTKSFIVMCPVWNLEQMDIGDHRWTWGPSFGTESGIYIDVIDNSITQEIECVVVFSDSMDWDGDGWADWSRSSEKETSGVGAQTLSWYLPEEGILSRDRFLTVECVLPPPDPAVKAKSSRIAGYTYIAARYSPHAE